MFLYKIRTIVKQASISNDRRVINVKPYCVTGMKYIIVLKLQLIYVHTVFFFLPDYQ